MKFNKVLLKKTLKDDKLNFIYQSIKNIKNLKILEFGVREGISTNMYLSICERNKGKLVSVDVDDCSHLFKNKNWTFLHCRDDNFQIIRKYIKKLDIIYIDSFHEPNHIKKIFYYYYNFLKPNGYIFIDDISWLPYIKKSYRENSFNEVINRNTFNKLLEIYFSNRKNMNIEFNFQASGTAKIQKKNNSKLKEPFKIFNYKKSLKYNLKKYFRRLPKK